MVAKVLKIPMAFRNGRLVHISEVESGLRPDCVCPACQSPLIARKGAIKVHHFAHAGETNCQPETVTHLLGKQLLFERLEAALKDGRPLPISWKCGECHDPHELDLMQGVVRVQVECHLGSLRPDVVLFGATDDVRAILEVVVSHAPEANVIDYCAAKKVPIFEYRIKKMGDLEAMRVAPQMNPSESTLCTRPKCAKCGGYLVQKTVRVVPGHCWKCGAGMSIGFVDCEGLALNPEQMEDAEVALAESMGACLRKNWSTTRNESYLSNTCKECGALTGSHYLHDFENEEGGQSAAAGMGCTDCALYGDEEPE